MIGISAAIYKLDLQPEAFCRSLITDSNRRQIFHELGFLLNSKTIENYGKNKVSLKKRNSIKFSLDCLEAVS